MTVGLNTTATTLAISTYMLATNQEVQAKLRTLIRQQWPNTEQMPDVDVIVNLPYLDMFVREVLRMYPVSMQAMTRECNTSTVVCNHKIQEG